MSVFLVAPKCSLPAPLFIFNSFLSQSIHFRHKFVSPLFSLVAPLFNLVAPKKKEADARSDLPLGIPKGDAWLVQESDRNEYKDLQSDYRIANAYTQRDWIANPVEPPAYHERPPHEKMEAAFFHERPAFFHERPAFFCPRPWDIFYSPFTTHQQTPFTNNPPSTLHLPPSTLHHILGATKKSLTRVRRARARERCALCIEIVPQKTFIAQQKRCDERFFLTFVTLFFHREQQKQ